ncbi:MAG: PIN domain-containing protein [Acidobacteriota bacterium]
MIAYLDSSVVLRIVLRQGDALEQWPSVTHGIVSALVEVECLRTLDRLRVTRGVSDHEITLRREAVYRLLESASVVDLTRTILRRASQPLPTSVATLDAIHLATALLWRERTDEDIVMATHDAGLAMAARACGLRSVGV